MRIYKFLALAMVIMMASHAAVAGCRLSCRVSDDSIYIYVRAQGETCMPSGAVKLSVYGEDDEILLQTITLVSGVVMDGQRKRVGEYPSPSTNAQDCSVSWFN